MCEKIFKIKTIFFQIIQFFDGILYNILLLFGGLFISGGLRPLSKWPIASAGPGYACSYVLRGKLLGISGVP